MITDKQKLAQGICRQLQMHNAYSFRPVRIDGIYCYIVIYDSPKVINFESVHVRCKINEETTEKYSLLYRNYVDLENAIDIVEDVVAHYKIYNGDLVGPIDYELLKLEEQIIPYEESQKCSICFEPTQEMTNCKHYLCFHCREECINNAKYDCPLCRKPGVVKFFDIDNHLLNNIEYSALREVRSNVSEESVEESEASVEESEASVEESEASVEESVAIEQIYPIQSDDDEIFMHSFQNHHPMPFMFLWNLHRSRT
jgi:hypothetical protein